MGIDNDSQCSYRPTNSSRDDFSVEETGSNLNPLIFSDEELKNVEGKYATLSIEERRTLTRVLCKGSLVFYDAKGRIVNRGVVRDISSQGMSVEIPSSNLTVGDFAVIEFSTSTHFSLSQVHCQIKRIAALENSEKNQQKVGIELCKLTTVQKKRMDELVASMTYTGFSVSDR